MNSRQQMQDATIGRAIDALEPIVEQYPMMRDVARMRDKLAAHRKQIDTARDEQTRATAQRSHASVEVKETQKTLRTVHLIQVARQAKPLFRHDPTVMKALRLPPVRGTPENHVTAALDLAKALRPPSEVLRRRGVRERVHQGDDGHGQRPPSRQPGE